MKNLNQYLLSAVVLSVILLAVSSCKDNFVSPASPSGTSIGAKISSDANLRIMIAALNKTNQAASLSNNNSGIFTVFAPSDSAFLVYFQSKLTKPAYTVDSVVTYISNMSTSTAITISGLSSILTYHMISSNLPSSALTGNGQVFSTLNGARLSISKTGSTLLLNANISAFNSFSGATIQTMDDFAANGVIYTINRVLIPVSAASAAAQLGISVSYGTNPPTVTVSASATNYNIEANAIAVTGLAPIILPNISPLPEFTVFAAQDADFVTYLSTTFPASGVTSEATAITFVKGLSASTTPTLADFTETIKKHIVPGRFVSTDFAGQALGTLSVSFQVTANTNNISNFPIVTKDLLTNAGVVHVISGVLH